MHTFFFFIFIIYSKLSFIIIIKSERWWWCSVKSVYAHIQPGIDLIEKQKEQQANQTQSRKKKRKQRTVCIARVKLFEERNKLIVWTPHDLLRCHCWCSCSRSKSALNTEKNNDFDALRMKKSNFSRQCRRWDCSRENTQKNNKKQFSHISSSILGWLWLSIRWNGKSIFVIIENSIKTIFSTSNNWSNTFDSIAGISIFSTHTSTKWALFGGFRLKHA